MKSQKNNAETKQLSNQERYSSLNELRAIACFGIIIIHMLANVNYTLDNDTLVFVIESFTDFILLFMILLAFSMCCGYYNKIKEGNISLEKFYSRRIKKYYHFSFSF